MIIKNLEISNFRSFADDPISLRFSDGINIIVGENNVGKSNILKAFELIKGKELTSEDYYKGETERVILINVTVELNKSEMKNVAIRLLGNRRSRNRIRRIVSELHNVLELEYSSASKETIVRFRDFWLSGNLIRLLSDNGLGSYQGIAWEDIAREYFSAKERLSLVSFVKEKLKSSGTKKAISLQEDLSSFILGMFGQKTKNFAEIRQCPSGSNQKVYESYDGALVADVLSNLKNGNLVQRSKWERIKQEFHNLFPNLKLEVSKPAGETPRIMIVKETIEYEVPVSFVGAGIWENIILLTHLFSFENMCFGIDMPELHFHHHTTRLLRRILREKSNNNQFLIVTHSPIFIEPDRLESVLVAREKEGKTCAKQLDKVLKVSEKERLRRHLDENTREFFFSRAVLIVEGPTEKGALPIFSKYLNQDFDKYGISVVEAGSQFSGTLTRVLKAFDFPYLVMHDKDALMYICQSLQLKKRSIKTSAVFCNIGRLLKKKDLKFIEDLESKIQSVRSGRGHKEIYPDEIFEELRDIALKYDVYILPTDFEGILKRNKYEKFMKEARKLMGRKKSKVICGRYVAEKIAEKNLKVPKEFSEVIDKVVKKSTL